MSRLQPVSSSPGHRSRIALKNLRGLSWRGSRKEQALHHHPGVSTSPSHTAEMFKLSQASVDNQMHSLSSQEGLDYHSSIQAQTHSSSPPKPAVLQPREQRTPSSPILVPETIKPLDREREPELDALCLNKAEAKAGVSAEKLIQEQAAIWEQIQRENTKGVHRDERDKTRSIQPIAAEDRSRVTRQSRADETGKSSKDFQPRLMKKDRTFHHDTHYLADGTKVRVKGVRHVYDSIAEGKARLVECHFCSTVSQVDKSSKALYCLMCQQISPLQQDPGFAGLARGNSERTWQSLPTHFRHGDSNHDASIAQVMQQQEKDAALARKLAAEGF